LRPGRDALPIDDLPKKYPHADPMTSTFPRNLLFASVFVGGALFAMPLAAAEDYSVAERALFMDQPFTGLKPPVTLRYAFHKRGQLEDGFDDRVVIALSAQADGTCCATSAEFLSGPRQLKLPDLDSAQANPVVLYFLERDIGEMQRLTKGRQNYFRKLIRMAAYQGARVRDVNLSFRGSPIAGHEIELTPYADDPLRARYDRFASKTYVFTLADAVPGGVYSIVSRIQGESADSTALIVEELVVEGAVSTSPPLKP
jgi:hypothetical protein